MCKLISMICLKTATANYTNHKVYKGNHIYSV